MVSAQDRAPTGRDTPASGPASAAGGRQGMPPPVTPDAGVAAIHARSEAVAIAEDALAHWNEFVRTRADDVGRAFLGLAGQLLNRLVPTGEEASGWPIAAPAPAYHAVAPWLSARAQALGLLVLLRAHAHTGDETFLFAADRVARTFERDILDGGVVAPLGTTGIIFEEVAVYPAAHVLGGFLLALVALDDYASARGMARVGHLLRGGHDALHALLDAYTVGFGTRLDLLSGRLARRSELAGHARLLALVGARGACPRCSERAARWARMARGPQAAARRGLARASGASGRALWRPVRWIVFGRRAGRAPTQLSMERGPARVCIPITAFPIAGGMRSVMIGWLRAMAPLWQMEFLAHIVGENPDGYAIHRFGWRLPLLGNATAAPDRFPNVWVYAISGWIRLVRVLRRSPDYLAVLPQDGVYTGAFAALSAKMAGMRVVVTDHGNLTLLDSDIYRRDRLQLAQRGRSGPRRALARIRLAMYFVSLRVFTWVTVRCADMVLPAGDDVDETCRVRLRMPPHRLSRFPFMIDVDRFTPLEGPDRARMRARWGLPGDAIIVAMVNRLAPEKGLDTAVRAIRRALTALPPAMADRVRVVVAGEGNLRAQFEQDLGQAGLAERTLLLGDTPPEDVASLLRISDVLLFTPTRGIASVAILEAMAAECGVIATLAPRSNAQLLAQGRGITTAIGDVEALAGALVTMLASPEQTRQHGRAARAYVVEHHTAVALRRSLLRATFWQPPLPPIGPGLAAPSASAP